MRGEKLTRHVLIALALTVILYLVTFQWIEHRRTRKGGWRVTFQTNEAGRPSILVAQAWLGITNVSFVFPDQRIGATNLQSTLVFDQPLTNVPFGKVVYFDTTFLPGAIVLDTFHHQIQLLPRVLILDQKEVPWQSGETFQLR